MMLVCLDFLLLFFSLLGFQILHSDRIFRYFSYCFQRSLRRPCFCSFFLVILFYLDSFLTYDICFVYFFLNFCILLFLFFLLIFSIITCFFIIFLNFICILTLICLLLLILLLKGFIRFIFLYQLRIFLTCIYKILIINIPKINRLTWKYDLRMLF